MSNQDVLTALDAYLKRNQTLDQAQGQIQTITGATALVRVMGSNRVQEAYYSKGANLSPGDQCILVRTNRNSRWIVMGGYNTSYAGHNDTTPPASASSGSQGVVANTKTSATGTVSLTATRQNILSIAINTAGNPILVGVSGDFYNSSTTVPNSAIADVALDGATVTGNSNYATWASLPLSAHANASFTLLFTGVAAGDHTVVLNAQFMTGTTGAAVSYTITSFWAIEL